MPILVRTAITSAGDLARACGEAPRRSARIPRAERDLQVAGLPEDAPTLEDTRRGSLVAVPSVEVGRPCELFELGEDRGSLPEGETRLECPRRLHRNGRDLIRLAHGL